MPDNNFDGSLVLEPRIPFLSGFYPFPREWPRHVLRVSDIIWRIDKTRYFNPTPTQLSLRLNSFLLRVKTGISYYPT